MQKLIFLLAVIAIPRFCPGAESCLWLNEATAAGILGGPVTLRVSHLPHATPATTTANAKSSAGPLSANASAANYSSAGADDEDCFFARTVGAISSEIRIEVRTMYESRAEWTSRLGSCRSEKVALRALGNEAIACNPKQSSAGQSEQIVGRVRERAFLVRVTSNDPASDQAKQRESAQSAAQIVAGNLF